MVSFYFFFPPPFRMNILPLNSIPIFLSATKISLSFPCNIFLTFTIKAIYLIKFHYFSSGLECAVGSISILLKIAIALIVLCNCLETVLKPYFLNILVFGYSMFFKMTPIIRASFLPQIAQVTNSSSLLDICLLSFIDK